MNLYSFTVTESNGTFQTANFPAMTKDNPEMYRVLNLLRGFLTKYSNDIPQEVFNTVKRSTINRKPALLNNVVTYTVTPKDIDTISKIVDPIKEREDKKRRQKSSWAGLQKMIDDA